MIFTEKLFDLLLYIYFFKGWTPLHLAAQEGHTEVASLLIENSGEVNIKTNKVWNYNISGGLV